MKPRALFLVATAIVVEALFLPGVAVASPPVVSAAATPAAISPNGDGIQDSTAIDVTVDQPVTLGVVVQNGSGVTVATLLAAQSVPSGTQSLAWNGSGQPDGSYTVVASAFDGTTTAEGTTPVAIDTAAPDVEWKSISPEPVMSTNPVHFEFHTSDPGAGQLDETLTIYDHAGSLDDQTSTKDQGETILNWTPKYASGTPVVDGLYGARIKATDAAGNTASTDRRPFRVLRQTDSKIFYELNGVGDRMALSFDDCNDAGAWARILRILRDKHVTTTFFCLGQNVARYPKLARETLADGHTIGNHSWNHPDLTTLGYSSIRSQIERTTNIWWKVAQATPAPYFRPPYGSHNSTVVKAAGDAGYPRTMLWDVDPRDWERPGASEIVNRVVPHVHHGAIVVMHVQDQTAQALPQIINGIRNHHLEPVSLTELFDAAGYRTQEPATGTDAATVATAAAALGDGSRAVAQSLPLFE